MALNVCLTSFLWPCRRTCRTQFHVLNFLAASLCVGGIVLPLHAQTEPATQPPSKFQGETTQDYNARLEEMRQTVAARTGSPQADDYRIGPEDLLEITVFEAPELNGSPRVSAKGEISLPLLGAVKAAGLTPQELESVLEELLRRSYMKEPHVGVFVREMESHPVSVLGAVRKPGVFRIRGSKSLLEMLSMAEGLADDAGDTVLVMRGAGFTAAATPSADNRHPPEGADPDPPAAVSLSTETVAVNLKELLDSADPRYNVRVYPGDVVKVTRAGIVYVVGEVKRPGGFVLRNNENISALQALALAEGLTPTSAKSRARIIRTDGGTGKRSEIALDLGKIIAGKVPDPLLVPKDIVFVPNSAGRTALYRGADAAISIVSGVVVFRRW